jgi:hypothetical protein
MTYSTFILDRVVRFALPLKRDGAEIPSMGHWFDANADFIGKIVRLKRSREGILITVRRDGETSDETYRLDSWKVVTNDCVPFRHAFSLEESVGLAVINDRHYIYPNRISILFITSRVPLKFTV